MYSGIITMVHSIRKHPNADKIQLGTCLGEQVVISLDTKENELGIYFPCDGQLSEEFCLQNNLLPVFDETGKKIGGGYFDSKRRVRAQKFRGEKSEGFWIPINSLSYTGFNTSKFKEGDLITNLNNHDICTKYVTQATRGKGSGKVTKKHKIKRQYPMFKEHVDTDQFMRNVEKIEVGSYITITEKAHGSSGRSTYCKVISNEPTKFNFLRKFGIKLQPKVKEEWKYVCGTRRVILNTFEEKAYYETNDFRKIHHEKFINNLRRGETIYYEIVGYTHGENTIMPKCSNSKLKDKEFIKKYGKETIFKYGCLEGTSRIFVYRITMTNEDGYTVEYPWQAMIERCKELAVEPVKLLCEPFIYDGNKEELVKLAERHCEGNSILDSSHIREGCVIRVDNGLNFEAYKHKNFSFKVMSDIIKDTEVVDIEEAQEFSDENN